MPTPLRKVTPETFGLLTYFPGCEPDKKNGNTIGNKKQVAPNGTVDPIRDKNEIALIAKRFLKKGQMRNATLFLIGCSVGLRASDLTKLQLKDFDSADGRIRLKEQKTAKYRNIYFNDLASACFDKLVGSFNNPTGDTYLFQSCHGSNKPLEVRSVAKILRKVQNDLNLATRLGTHSMRKTFGYHLFMDNQKSPEILAYLQDLFNHSSSTQTLRYIGLIEDRRRSLYTELDFGFTLDEL